MAWKCRHRLEMLFEARAAGRAYAVALAGATEHVW